MKKIKLLYKKYKEIINYIIVGGMTTVVGLGIYYILVISVLDPLKPVELQIANISVSYTHLNQINSITEKCLEQTYNKSDIIIFSVINYEFRYQRPQHFAARFAENGHRVFYINANFVSKDSIKSVSNNLYAVDFHNENCNAIYYAPDCVDFDQWFREKMDNLVNLYAISDAVIVLDYPNWVNGAEYLRKTYGFKITVDLSLIHISPACGVPVLVLRTETERPEAVQAGTVKVVGVDEEVIFNEAVNLIDNKSEYEKMAHAVNPYGDGHASERIATYIEN